MNNTPFNPNSQKPIGYSLAGNPVLVAGGSMTTSSSIPSNPGNPTAISGSSIHPLQNTTNIHPYGGLATADTLEAMPGSLLHSSDAIAYGSAAASNPHTPGASYNTRSNSRREAVSSPAVPPHVSAAFCQNSVPVMSMAGGGSSTASPMVDTEDMEDSDMDEAAPRTLEKRAGRRKIRIEYIEDKSRRHITFSKRKAGIMKKAYELSTLTGTQVLLLVASETGHVYTFATPKLQPLITKPEGKNLIQACLNAPDISTPDYSQHHQLAGGYENDDSDDRQVQAAVSAAHASIPANYAAAIAGLAGYQYPNQAGPNAGSAGSAAYINPAHYPAYAAAAAAQHQYNQAMAAGYWSQAAATGAVSGDNSTRNSSSATSPSYSPSDKAGGNGH